MPKKEPKVESKQLSVIKDGMGSPFWREIKRILESEKAEINANILAKDDLGLDDKTVSDLIKWHGFLTYVVNLPENCILALESKKINDGTNEEEDSNDPYPLSEVREKIKNGK